MADPVVVKFQADLEELKKGVAQVSTLLKTQVGKQQEQVARGFKVSGGQIKSAMRDVAEGVALVGAVLGSQTSQFLLYASTAISAVAGIGKALAGLVGGPVAAVIVALAAVGAAVVAAITNWDDFKKIAEKAWLAIQSGIQKTASALVDLLLKIPFLGEGFRSQLLIAQHGLENFRTEISRASSTLSSLDAKVAALKETHASLLKIFEDAGKGMHAVSVEEELFGKTQETARKETDLLKKALIDLASKGAREGHVWFDALNEEYQESVARLKEMENATAAQKRTQEELNAATQRANQIASAQKIVNTPISELISEDAATGAIERIAEVRVALAQWVNDLQVSSAEIGLAFTSATDALVQGLGDAVAQAIVYGTDLGTALVSVLKNVAAQLISTLIQLGIQALLNLIIGNTILAARLTAELATNAAITYAAAFAATAGIPIVGPFIAPGVAAGAVAAMLAGAATSYGTGASAGAGLGGGGIGLAKGGVVTGPTNALIGEAGTEFVLPLRRAPQILRETLQGGGGLFSGFGGRQLMAPVEVVVYTRVDLDGRELARGVSRHQPSILKQQGVR